MPAHTAPTAELPSEFSSALGKLQTLFGEALWKEKFNSCGFAWDEIKRTTSTKKKTAIIDEKFQQWLEGSVTAVKEWLPKFVALAEAFPELSDGNTLQWAKGKVWDVVEGQCGLRRTERGGVACPDDRITRTMVYWFAVASEGKLNVNKPPLRPWKAPRWLARDGNTDSLLRERQSVLWGRLNHAIDGAFDIAQIQKTIGSRDAALRQSQTRASADGSETAAPAGGHGVVETEEPIFRASEDYRSIRYKGGPYTLTRNQSTIIRLLHEAHQRGTPDLGKDILLAAIGYETSRVRDSFKNSPLWGKLVISGRRRGTYRLNLT